jgi:two-component system NtrC family sensor kinase
MRQRGGSEQPVKGRRANRPKARKGSTATSSMADLQRQIGTLTRELKEANERQTATTEVLRIVASSPENLQPVFDAMLEKAIALCEAKFGILFLYDGRAFTVAAHRNLPPAFAQAVHGRSFSAETNTGFRRLVESKAPVHITDMFADSSYTQGEPLRVAAIELGGVRSFLAVPLLRKGELIGNFSIYRGEPGGFDENQIALAKTFADQAVIAIENARLLNETKEALERQTATAEVLRVIASSPSDLQPVFEAIATRSTQLVGGHSAAVSIFVGDMVHLGAFTPVSPEADAALKSLYPRRLADYPLFELARGGEVSQVSDIETDTRVPSAAKASARARGFRSLLLVPMNSDAGPIGVITVTRKDPGTFAAQHIQLLQTFADQAVIAIENARLFDEVQAKTRDLEESLQQQTATSDVLKVISRSAFDLQSVLDTLVKSAVTLSGARVGTIFQERGGLYHLTAQHGCTPEILAFGRAHPIAPDMNSSVGRTAMTGTAVQIPDVFADPHYTRFGYQRLAGFRALLAVPLIREGKVEGVFSLGKQEPGPFAQRQVELIRTFADQAVIAIGNVRLFEDVQAKTRDLEESLQQQTATSEVLQVISSSPGELKPVFQALLENATRVCGAKFGSMTLYDGDSFENVALHNAPPAFARARENKRFRPHPRSPLSDLVRTKQVVITDDLRRSPAYLEGNPVAIELADIAGARTVVNVPMLKDAVLIGVITLYRQEVRPSPTSRSSS